MKKDSSSKLRKMLISFLVSGVALASLAVMAFANADSNVENTQTKRIEDHFSRQGGYTLISEETYIDENGWQIILRSYEKNEV